MRLIILYGPPASGKLTIAKELACVMKAPLLHNHLVADFAHAVFDYGTLEYANLARAVRLAAVKAALEAETKSLIMTFAYGLETREGAEDDAVLEEIKQIVEGAGGSVVFVRLTADRSILMERVAHESRKEFDKLIDPTVLEHILNTYPKTQMAIPFAESFTIDAGSVLPSEAVERIMSFH